MKKRVTYAKISPEMVSPRELGNAEEAERRTPESWGTQKTQNAEPQRGGERRRSRTQNPREVGNAEEAERRNPESRGTQKKQNAAAQRVEKRRRSRTQNPRELGNAEEEKEVYPLSDVIPHPSVPKP